MSRKYNNNLSVTGVTRFSQSAMSDVEFSKMTANPHWYVPFNGGDIVPVYYNEVLPHSTISLDLDFVVRQTTSLVPVMGDLQLDIFAFFVPNRIINESWKNVMGENTSGFWTAPEVNLAPLFYPEVSTETALQIPKGSISDYYGFPTQQPISSALLAQCNDLKQRGYLECYNTYFRDENYLPPVPYSKLNIYNGFLTYGAIPPSGDHVDDLLGGISDGNLSVGAITKAVAGEGGTVIDGSIKYIDFRRSSTSMQSTGEYNFLCPPLKACKLHDAFTSALPSPQKGQEVFISLPGNLPVRTGDQDILNTIPLRWRDSVGLSPSSFNVLGLNQVGDHSNTKALYAQEFLGKEYTEVAPSNLYVDLASSAGISINDLRTAISVQQVYETLARGGSRYTEILNSFFGIATENPFDDKPTQLGHIRRNLDLFQVAQTSASVTAGTPQGNLTAFGYTNNGGHLFTRTFLEHGYIHVFAVVRHRNVYSTYFAPDNLRLNTLDFYNPHLANISEQPIPLSVLNPFVGTGLDRVLGYQEAWWEYRYEPDRVFGDFRPTVPGTTSLAQWTYADNFDTAFDVVNGNWLLSNTEEVLNRSLAVTSDEAPQFMGYFSWKVEKELPMPIYSIPGLDTI